MKVWYGNTLISIFLIDFADLICDDFFLAFVNVWQPKLTLKEVVHEKFTSFEPLELSLLWSNPDCPSVTTSTQTHSHIPSKIWSN